MSFKSKSPVTGENYSYPKDSKDKSEINAFLDKNKSLGRKIVGVIGLGFVGAATATMISDTESDNYAVIGFDIENEGSFWKIADINSGKLPLNCGDDELSSAFSRSFSHNKILATGALDFLKNCDVIMVAINLDVSKEYSLSGEMNYEVLYKPYLDCIEGVGQRMDQNALLILESTLPVGFTEYSVLPIIKEQFEKRNLDNNQILLGHSYERVTPGKNYLNSMKNFYRVYSGINEASKIATRSF